MKKIRVGPASSAVLAVVLFVSACHSGGSTIRIGMAGPFSQPRGASMRLAALQAEDEIDRAGGIGGRKLELVFGDDSASNDAAVRVAQRFAGDPTVLAVVGHLTSGNTLAAAAIYNGAHPLAVISPSASAPGLTDAGPWTFVICPTDFAHGAALARFARTQLHAATAAVEYQDDEYGRGVRNIFEQDFATAGGQVAFADPYLDQIPVFRPYIERIKRRGGVQALLIAGTRAGAERILATLDSVGTHPAVLAGDGVVGIEAGGKAEGLYVSSAYLPDRPGDKNAAFVKAYQARYPGQLPDHRGAGAYDVIYLLKRAIESGATTRAAIRDYLAGVGTRTPAFDGVTGSIAFDEHRDVPAKDVVIGQVRNKRLVTVAAGR
ncbi:MAG TPA: ABC transporter substrate-binding protein [Gemmatimonadales bacterium]|nr:ABC transporter substrate-binding protein [Gemmatimonadales bacterium]